MGTFLDSLAAGCFSAALVVTSASCDLWSCAFSLAGEPAAGSLSRPLEGALAAGLAEAAALFAATLGEAALLDSSGLFFGLAVESFETCFLESDFALELDPAFAISPPG